MCGLSAALFSLIWAFKNDKAGINASKYKRSLRWTLIIEVNGKSQFEQP